MQWLQAESAEAQGTWTSPIPDSVLQKWSSGNLINVPSGPFKDKLLSEPHPWKLHSVHLGQGLMIHMKLMFDKYYSGY